MRIGIDARMYGPKQGGLGRYIEQLILHLEKIVEKDTFFIFLRKENWNEYHPSTKNFKKELADIPWYGWKEQLYLPKILKKNNLDLIHFPHWNIPLGYKNPFVVTIHDLLLFHFPTRASSTLGPVSYWFKNHAFRIVLNQAIKKSRHILTVSNYSKQDIIKNFHTDPTSISVTYLAPFLKSAAPTSLDTHKILKKYNISLPYLLYVGVAYPHKNLDGLLEAWNIYTKKHSTYQLVLVGKKNYFYKKLFEKAQKLRLKNIIFTDFVPDDELIILYRNSSLYIMPSFYEGSALPSLESLYYGIPVISSNATCLPEILKDAACYFDPHDHNQIAKTIELVLDTAKIRNDLIVRGKKVYSSHSWSTVALETLKIYHATDKK